MITWVPMFWWHIKKVRCLSNMWCRVFFPRSPWSQGLIALLLHYNQWCCEGYITLKILVRDSAVYFKTNYKFLRQSIGVRRNFSMGASQTSAYPFHVADDVVQMDVHKTLYTFLHRKANPPWKHTHHSHPFWNRTPVEVYTNLPKRCTFCQPVQLLLNWRIIQYCYHCGLQKTGSELDLKHPQLRLWCSH